MKISVILPTYNESETLPGVLERIDKTFSFHSLQGEVLVVDDGSPDGTADAAGSFRGGGSVRLRVIRRGGRRGLASAVREGAENAAHSFLIIMDADGSHPPEAIPQLVSVLEDADIASGSRFRGGRMEAPVHKIAASRLMNVLIRLLLHLDVRDCTGGFISCRREDFLSIPNRSFGGEYCIEFLYRALMKGSDIREVPITYVYRSRGRSKTRLIRDGARYLRCLFRLRRGTASKPKTTLGHRL